MWLDHPLFRWLGAMLGLKLPLQIAGLAPFPLQKGRLFSKNPSFLKDELPNVERGIQLLLFYLKLSK